MLEFYCPNRKSDGTPVICDLQVMAYAEAQIGDYNPELLRVPGKLDALDFVKFYLNAVVDVQDIKNTFPGMEINGITVLKDAAVRVRDDGEIATVNYPAGAIIIDKTVMGRGDGYELFTICHEGGHYCMHYPVFCGSEMLAARSNMDKIMCRSNTIGTVKSENKRWSDRDFMEHQANVYSASLLMPRPSFVPFVMALNMKAGFGDGIFVRPRIDPYYQYRDWYANLDEIGLKIAEKFGVSESAAYVHMKRCGLIRKEDPKDLPIYIRQGVAV